MKSYALNCNGRTIATNSSKAYLLDLAKRLGLVDYVIISY
jgi:hypothetical protein